MLDDDQYEFTISASPDEIVPMIVQGQVDIAAVPANLAAVLYQKTQKQVNVLAVNTLGIPLSGGKMGIASSRWKT